MSTNAVVIGINAVKRVQNIAVRFSALSRTRKTLCVVALFLFSLVCTFFVFRFQDRNAWPEATANVRLDVDISDFEESSSNAWCHLEELVSQENGPQQLSDALLAELDRFDAFGLSFSNKYPVLEREAESLLEKTNEWFAAASASNCVPRYGDFEQRKIVLLSVMRFARVSSYAAAKYAAAGEWKLYVDMTVATLSIARHSAENMGVAGVFVALNVASSAARDIFLAACEYDIPDDIAEKLVRALFSAELPASALPDAIRIDRASAIESLMAMFIPASQADPEKRNTHPSASVIAFMKLLGSSPKVSVEHLDVMASKAVATAEAPFKYDAFFSGMPEWCRLGKRTPWTRDPFGTLVSSMFIRNISPSFAYPPLQSTELRAAIAAILLKQAKKSSVDDKWPNIFPAGVTNAPAFWVAGPDFYVDPFSSEGLPFEYSLDSDGWTLKSVGLDQSFNPPVSEGTRPDYSLKTDIIYTSGERARRISEWNAKSKEGQGRNDLSSTSGDSTI